MEGQNGRNAVLTLDVEAMELYEFPKETPMATLPGVSSSSLIVGGWSCVLELPRVRDPG